MSNEIINPKARCMECGYVLECATHPEDDNIRPEPGNLSICFNCGNLGIYTEGMFIRNLEEQELEEIKEDRETWEYILNLQHKIVTR